MDDFFSVDDFYKIISSGDQKERKVNKTENAIWWIL